MSQLLPVKGAGPTSRAAGETLRIVSTILGVWLTGLAPVERVVEGRRAVNAATGYMPNMDPGVITVLATLFAAAIVAIVLVAELARRWAWGGTPLAVLSHTILGALAAAPIGVAFTVERFRGGGAVLLISSLMVVLFYAARGLWLQRHRRQQSRSDHEV